MSTPTAAAQSAADIKPATGKLGIMIPGMGAVATTLIAGVEAVRRGFSKPIGSLTQMGPIRLGKRNGSDTYAAPRTAEVLDRDQLHQMKPFLESIQPMPAAFDQHYVKRLASKKS